MTNPYIVDIALLCAVFVGLLLGSLLPEPWALGAMVLCGVLLFIVARRSRDRGSFRDRGE